MRSIVALVLFCFPVMAQAGTLQQEVIDPYVEIHASGAIGSGVAVEWNGDMVVLTAAHVANCNKQPDGTFTPMTLVKESEEGGYSQMWTADVLRVGDKADLAVLKPRHPAGLHAAHLMADISAVERGEDCWYVGTAHGVHAGLEKSIINRPAFGTPDGRSLTLVNGNGWYGNSGGPLFVKRGDDYYLVGIIVVLTAGNDPKAPVGAENLASIEKFLKAGSVSFFDKVRKAIRE